MMRSALHVLLPPFLLSVLLGVLLGTPPAGEPALAEEAAANGVSPAGVGDPVCLRCHRTVDLGDTSHAVLAKSLPDSSCEACHGPGKEHARDPEKARLPGKGDPARTAALCLSCHRSGPDHVTAWAESDFAKKGMSCRDCHTVHAASEARLHFVADEKGYLGDDACRMCHGNLFAAFGRSFHAEVLGKPGGGCEACHGPGRDHARGARDLAGGRGPARIAGKPDTSACLLCHRSRPDRHARKMAVYREKRPACTTCHRVHVDRDDPLFAETGGPAPGSGARAGTEACGRCHGAAIRTARESVHASLLAAEDRGCEACHGPAGHHVRSGGRARFVVNPERLPPEKASALCLSCHGDKPDHARDWKGGDLEKRGLSCLTCHRAHGKSEDQGKPVVRAEGKVGSKTCRVCHADAHPDLSHSPHARLMKGPGARGCEACHGPGAAHVAKGGDRASIRNPARLPPERRAGFCLDCHRTGSTHFAWDRGAHARAGLACTTCHDSLAGPETRSKKREPALCLACHGDVGAEFRLPNHHPLERGAVTCTSCHDVHQEDHGFLSLASRKDRCVACHTDKRGPFLYEHEADRRDGCVVCHRPHGSMNRRLLTHRTVRALCIQCHVTPASHSLSRGSQFRNCLSCHGSIHGSYVDKRFFR